MAGLTVCMHHTEISHVIAGESDGRLPLELGFDVALPEIGRLHDVHVTIEDLKSTLRHTRLPRLS